MRTYLLDTTPLAALLSGRPLAVALIRPWMTAHTVATRIIVYGEVIEHLKGRPDFFAYQAALHDLLLEIQPIFLDYSILERYADLRRALRPPHGPGLIGDMDTLIAATALGQQLTVVTTDAHFLRIPELDVSVVTVR